MPRPRTFWFGALVVSCTLLAINYNIVGLVLTVSGIERWRDTRHAINRLKSEGWASKLGITDQQLQCCASESLSQDLEDLRILEILLLAAQAQGTNTFVELGALDGRRYSNTWMLEKCFGWHGLLIEGSPVNFEKLNRYRASGDNVLRNLAVCPARGQHFINFTVGGDYGAAVGGESSVMSDHFKSKWKHLHGYIVPVRCKPLDVIMRESGMSGAAFLSLDVEGAELKVIKNAKPSMFQVIMVEMDGHDMVKDFEVHKEITTAGLVEPFKSMSALQGEGVPPMGVPRSGLYLQYALMADYVKAASAIRGW